MQKTLVVSLALLIGFPCLAWGLTPESPEVKALVKKGLDYLERGAPVQNAGLGPGTMPAMGGDVKVGETVLVGLSFFKAGQTDHKLVQKAIQDVYGMKDFANI